MFFFFEVGNKQDSSSGQFGDPPKKESKKGLPAIETNALRHKKTALLEHMFSITCQGSHPPGSHSKCQSHIHLERAIFFYAQYEHYMLGLFVKSLFNISKQDEYHRAQRLAFHLNFKKKRQKNALFFGKGGCHFECLNYLN